MKYEVHSDITEDEARYLTGKLIEYADRFTSPRNVREIGFVIRGSSGEVVGGIRANTVWDWLQILELWVSEELRGSGHGRRLLEKAEQTARDLGCRHARLNTFEFEARGFYEARGYAVVSQTDGFPTGHTQYHLAKTL